METGKGMNDKKLHRRLQKLISLAERGEGGEKENAQRMLDNLLKKHGLSVSDIVGDKQSLQWFKYGKGLFELRLLSQIIYAVCGSRDKWKNTRRRYVIGVKCSEYERVQIELRFSVYREALKKEFEVIYDAFLHTNKIFPEKSGDEDSDDKDIDWDYLDRVSGAMANMSAVPVIESLPVLTE